jgi:hypothetical protein
MTAWGLVRSEAAASTAEVDGGNHSPALNSHCSAVYLARALRLRMREADSWAVAARLAGDREMGLIRRLAGRSKDSAWTAPGELLRKPLLKVKNPLIIPAASGYILQAQGSARIGALKGFRA